MIFAGSLLSLLALALMATAGAAVLVLVPRWTLLAAAVVMLRGFDVAPLGAVLSPLTVSDVLLIVFLLRSLTAVALGRARSLREHQLLLAMLVVWAIAATVVAHVSLTPIGRIGVYALLVILPVTRPQDRRRGWQAIAVFAAVELVVSLGELPTGLIGVHVGDPHNFAMLMLAAAVPFMAHDRDVWPRLPAWGHSALAGFFILAAAATGRRGILLAIGAMLVVAGLRHISLGRALTVMAAMLATGAVLYLPLSLALGLHLNSSAIRVVSIRRALSIAVEHLATGVGWGGLSTGVTSTTKSFDASLGSTVVSAYDLFVNVFASTGLLGLVLLLAFLVALLRRAAHHDRSVFLFLVAFCTLSLTEMTWYPESLVTLLFFVVSALMRQAPTDQATEDMEQSSGDLVGVR